MARFWMKIGIDEEHLIGAQNWPSTNMAVVTSHGNTSLTRWSCFFSVEWPRRSRIGPIPWQIRRRPDWLPAPVAPSLFPCWQSVPRYHKLRNWANEWEIRDAACDQLWGDIRAIQPFLTDHIHTQSWLGSSQWSYEAGGEIRIWWEQVEVPGNGARTGKGKDGVLYLKWRLFCLWRSYHFISLGLFTTISNISFDLESTIFCSVLKWLVTVF